MIATPRSVSSEAGVEHVAVFVAPPEAVSVIRAVLAYLPVNFPAAIVILLHVAPGRARPLADNLNVNRGLMVLPGEDGTVLRNNHGYVVLPEQRLAIGGDGRLTSAYGEDADDDAFLLDDSSDPAGQGFGGEALLASLAARYGTGAIAIALTELDVREAEGFRRVREAGGHTIALDEADRLWTRPSGPRVVPGPADECLSTRAIGERMLRILSPNGSHL
jgi:two-component system chemotaxis response regulator CheB